MSILLTRENLCRFGIYKFTGGSPIKNRNIYIYSNYDNPEEQFEKLCRDILDNNNNKNEYNYYKVKQLVYYLCINNYKNVTDILFKILKDASSVYGDLIMTKLNNNNLTIGYIVELYYEYINKVKELKSIALLYYDN